MPRSENIDVVESYLKGLASKDLSFVPFASGITFEGPLMPKLAGRETIVGFLSSILPLIKGIEIKQHIADGEYVATVFEMETVNGVDHVVDICRVVDGELTEIRAFYYPNQNPR
jgi:SnoaL-like domain